VIKVLYYGDIEVSKEMITVGIDAGLKIVAPYLGFLITNNTTNILFDNGINAKYIVDGKAWAGSPAKGGEIFVLEALRGMGLDPAKIDLVVYSHMHNDHAGNCHLFPDSVHLFQRDEWRELLDPLPSMMLRGDFDQSIVPVLKEMDCLKIDGDVELTGGLKLYKTPGHTSGSQVLEVATEKGKYILAGDTIHINHIAFPELTELITMEGKRIKITPAPKVYGPAIPSSLVYNHYDWYNSIYKIKAMLAAPEFLLAGHEPSLFGKTFPAQ
jgi:glyoxylase-like metal-dependent hydrolase (beta-lactamase superfamily II)